MKYIFSLGGYCKSEMNVTDIIHINSDAEVGDTLLFGYAPDIILQIANKAIDFWQCNRELQMREMQSDIKEYKKKAKKYSHMLQDLQEMNAQKFDEYNDRLHAKDIKLKKCLSDFEDVKQSKNELNEKYLALKKKCRLNNTKNETHDRANGHFSSFVLFYISCKYILYI